jgi:hypothetical protein
MHARRVFKFVVIASAVALCAACGDDAGADGGTESDAVSSQDDSGVADTGAVGADTGSATPDTAAAPDTSSSSSGGPGDTTGIQDGAADTKLAGDCPGGSGCDCASNGDCDTGICVQHADKNACASTCVDSCQSGFECKAVSAGADSINICVPTWAWLCDPCQKSSDCQKLGIEAASCVSHGNDGAFCGAPCASDSQCPDTHSCQDVESVEGAKSKQCAPKAAAGGNGMGACTCSAAARTKKLSTSCNIVSKNAAGEALGTCPGVRTCEPAGLSPCKGPPPSAEKCNGIDDDCDGKTDEGTCNDNNQCTADACDPKLSKDGKEGCVHNVLQGPCDADNSACTEGDKCKSGICVPGTAKNCDDGNECTADVCDAAAGCTQTNDDGKGCDADGNLCTVGDACTNGQCAEGKPKVCKSGDPCIDSKCNPLVGMCKLKSKPAGANCDDDSKCTSSDGCVDGSCVGKTIGCDDGNACTIDSCKATKGCVNEQGQSPCDDGSACTVGDLCHNGACSAGKPKPCVDGNPCTASDCDGTTGKCKFSKLTAACDDGNACTIKDTCSVTALCTGKAKDCEDNNPCTDESCDAKKGCTYGPNVAPCDDGDQCTSSSGCQGGKCVGLASKVSATCNDNNVCTVDGCDPNGGGTGATKGCTHQAKVGACSDGNPCTSSDGCQGGKCVAGPNTCVCQSHGDCAKQDDGNLCNGTLLCDTSGAKPKCVLNPASVVSCPSVSDTACNKNSCAAATGKCAMKAAQDGTDCNDGTVCTKGDTCSSGSCSAGTKVSCDDNNVCTDDSCNPLKGCTNVANTAPCDDGQVCSDKDTCAAKQCKAGKNICDCQKNLDCGAQEDGNACNGTLVCDKSKAPYKCVVDKSSIIKCDASKDTACNKASCQSGTGKCAQFDVNAGGSCSDGDACTVGDVCGKDNAGSHGCLSGVAAKCADGNDCTNDTCDKAKGCVNKGDTTKKLACYTGKAGTKDIGECKGGLRTCKADGSAGACDGEFTPSAKEFCDGKDDTCDGKTDEACSAGNWTMVVTTLSSNASAGKHDVSMRAGIGVIGGASGAGKTEALFGWRSWLKTWWGGQAK